MKKLLIISLLLIQFLAEAQTRVSGRVIDGKSKRPLEFAHVGILNTTIGTVSNSNGDYSLIIPDEYARSDLAASFLGYELFAQPVVLIKTDQPFNIELFPSATQLPEITVSVKQRNIFEEAIELILENHDQGDMRLRGFWRAQMKEKDQHIQLVETAFDIYRKDRKDVLRILKGRAIRDTASFEQYRQFNAGVSPRSLFAGSFLINSGITSKKFRKGHVFELVDVTSYQGRPVYVVKFDKTEKNEFGTQGEILLDTETLAFVKLSYDISAKNDEYQDVYTRLQKKITGLHNSKWIHRKIEFNYQLVDDRWYFSHAKFDVEWLIADKNKTFEIPITYYADFVATEISKKPVTLPEKDERAGKGILARQVSDMEDDFWESFTYLVPDQDFDKIFNDIISRNRIWREEQKEEEAE